MPVVERHDYINSFHHVYLRGLDRFPIFHDDQDRYKFLDCIEKAQKKYGFRIHAYCLMGNHYHLYFQSLQGNLSQSMHSINMRYSIYHNLKYKRSGPVFERRFNSKLVQSEKYSLSLIRYIHRNPIKAKLVTNLDDYFWSSYPVYIGKREPFNFLDFSLVAKQMRHDISFHKEFKQYHGIDVDDSIFDHESIIGDNDFIKDILDEAIVKDGYQKCNQVIIDELMINVISEYIAKLPEKENKRVRPCLVSKLTSLSNNEIASKFGLPSGDAVRQLCYRFKKALQDSENYQLMYKELLEAKQKLLGID